MEATQAGGVIIVIIIVIIIIIGGADATVGVVLVGDGIRCRSLLVVGDRCGFGCRIIIIFCLQDFVLVVAGRRIDVVVIGE